MAHHEWHDIRCIRDISSKSTIEACSMKKFSSRPFPLPKQTIDSRDEPIKSAHSRYSDNEAKPQNHKNPILAQCVETLTQELSY